MKSVCATKTSVDARATLLELALLFCTVCMTMSSAYAQTFKILYSFTGGADGSQPYSSLAMDSAGNLYGTTAVGGAAAGYGVVFKVTPVGKESVLYTFQGGADGANPWAGLYRDATGNLYGTTEAGGKDGFGTVFKLNAIGKKTTLYNFTGTGNDGAYTFTSLVQNRFGLFYGTTYKGGASGNGTVFRLSKSGTNETVLYSFKGGSDGQNPYAGVIRDATGNLYGTTYGSFGTSYGTVFKISKGKESVLHAFTGGKDGGFPFYGGLVMDTGGNLYGTTSYGGSHQYFGVVYKIDSSGNETVLYNFTGGPDGGQPNAGLVIDPAGNLYGTTVGGGANGHGTIFTITPKGKERVLYSFAGGTDAAAPDANLIMDAKGNLYGTSIAGGAKEAGTVFKLAR